jgi:hypothetical protein
VTERRRQAGPAEARAGSGQAVHAGITTFSRYEDQDNFAFKVSSERRYTECSGGRTWQACRG